MAYNKVVYNKNTLIDLTSDTVTAGTLFWNYTAHDKAGNKIRGTLLENYPNSVTIPVVTSVPTVPTTKEKNIVNYGSKTLIDISADTVKASNLCYGFRCHTKDGAIITGTLFNGYPAAVQFKDALKDSSGEYITDSSGNVIHARVVYKKGALSSTNDFQDSNNDVITDSSGNVVQESQTTGQLTYNRV